MKKLSVYGKSYATMALALQTYVQFEAELHLRNLQHGYEA